MAAKEIFNRDQDIPSSIRLDTEPYLDLTITILEKGK